MKFLSNLHTHTNHSDGQSTMEEYAKLATQKNFVSLGFSDHSQNNWDKYPKAESFDLTLAPEDFDSYLKEFSAVKERYGDKLELYLSVEDDYLPFVPKNWMDYSIGAVHDLLSPVDGKLYAVDASSNQLNTLVLHCGGYEGFVMAYYNLYAETIETYHPDIGAHFDLLTKQNKNDSLFSTTDSWYLNIAGEALERIKKTGTILEVNTGAISRGYATEPYPKKNLLAIMKDLEIPVTISSDAHHVSGLDCFFDEAVALLKTVGYKNVKQLQGGKFIDLEL